MNPETRNCQNCKKDFTIEPDDFSFYEKIKVPPPTFCDRCRLQRRLMWLKTTQLYKRKCDLCHKEGLSMYSAEAPYIVYCHDCWWSDKWDPMAEGKEYDFSRSFFDQYEELLHKSPMRAQPIDAVTRELSPYTNFAGHSKNCYLIFYSDRCEDTAHGFFLKQNKNTYDSSVVWECENTYDVTNGFKSYNLFTGEGNVISCVDSYFMKDCRHCTDCFSAVNLKNKSYVFFGEQLDREEYKKRVGEIDLGSYKTYEEMRTKARALWQSSIPRGVYDDFTADVTGNYVFESKNCKECYDVGYAEDSKFLMLIKAGVVRDCYDYMDGWTAAERMYECVTVGAETADVHFSQDGGHGLHSSDYTILCFGGSDLFGCVGLRNKKYCILNKQYSKEEYLALREKIIAQMTQDGEYGEFFPMKFSPHPYNDTLANSFFPKTKEEVLALGLRWLEPDIKEYTITMQNTDIPDNIKDAQDSILNNVIQCKTCVRGFRIIHQELQFLRKHNLPLPRQCPFCRIDDKIKRWVWQMTIKPRICDKCGVEFRTHYTEEQAPKIYCRKCYQETFL
jgi:hypothetical protein